VLDVLLAGSVVGILSGIGIVIWKKDREKKREAL